EEPDRLQAAAVGEDEREVLLAEQAMEGLAERHGRELRGHRPGRVRLAADLGARLAAELVEDLGHRDVRQPHREGVVLVADEPLGLGPQRAEQAGERQHDRGGRRAPPPPAPPRRRRPPPPPPNPPAHAAPPPRPGGPPPRPRPGGSGAGGAAAHPPRPRTLDGDSVVKPCIIMPRPFPPYGSTPGTLPPRVVDSVPHALVEGLLLASPLYVTTHL